MMPCLFLNEAVHFDATVGAYGGAGSAAYAFVGVGGVGEMVSSVVYFLRLKGEHISGASYNAKVAPFVDYYGS